MDTPTFEQMQQFFRLVDRRVVTTTNFQAFLDNPTRFLVGFPTMYDQSIGLTNLIKRAVGERNFANIDSDITQERFPLTGTSVRTVNLRVEPQFDCTIEQAAKRLVAAGYILGNTGDLAGFLHDHPEEVKKWSLVFAISEESRWASPGGHVHVPYASIYGVHRHFAISDFRDQLRQHEGILVVS